MNSESSPLPRRDFISQLTTGTGMLAASALGGATLAVAQTSTAPAVPTPTTPPAASGGGSFAANDATPFRYQRGVKTLWNVFRRPGQNILGGNSTVQPGERKAYLEMDGPGVIDYLWLTLNWPGFQPYPNNMLRNRSVIIEIFWDGSDKPAVSAPIGDFFGHILGYDIPFESTLFSDPSGRSYLCRVPMPFRNHVRIDIINDFDQPIVMCPDFRIRSGVTLSEDDGYFHAYWNRTHGDPAQNHIVLPEISGRGRYLGQHVGIISTPVLPRGQWCFHDLLWFLDEDTDASRAPTHRSNTLTDYSSSAWDFNLTYQHAENGLLFSKYFPEGGGHHGLYCHHLSDLIQFDRRARVEQKRTVLSTLKEVIDAVERDPGIVGKDLILPRPLAVLKAEHAKKPATLLLPYRNDHTTTALFYLDRPTGIAASCREHPHRKTPAHHWPVADQSKA